MRKAEIHNQHDLRHPCYRRSNPQMIRSGNWASVAALVPSPGSSFEPSQPKTISSMFSIDKLLGAEQQTFREELKWLQPVQNSSPAHPSSPSSVRVLVFHHLLSTFETQMGLSGRDLSVLRESVLFY